MFIFKNIYVCIATVFVYRHIPINLHGYSNFFVAVLEVAPRASHMLNMSSNTELHIAIYFKGVTEAFLFTSFI